MDTFEAIAQRRSIRKFKSPPVPQEMIEQVLEAAIQAPSAKNRQPWHFVVVQGEQRAEMVRVMREGIDFVAGLGVDLGSARWTAQVMEQAPVTIFIYNPYGQYVFGKPPDGQVWDPTDIQSVGAAIQNMLLAAQALGLGTLWICDVFYATDQFAKWLERDDQLVAAVSLGYPDEQPGPRPRKGAEQVVTWR